MKRVIVYGDIHGCLDEFKSLREKIEIKSSDIEVCVGDILNKGLYLANMMISYLQEHHIKVVIGNNEAKALKQYKQYKNKGEEYLQTLRPFEIATVLSLRDDDFLFLNSLPYFLKIKNLTILHGGLTPEMHLDKLDNALKKELTLIRFLNKELKPIPWSDQKNRYKFWTEVYDGREGFIVSGHHPFPEPKVDKYAVNIDTGCVYGGKLTAVVFKQNNDQIDTENYKFFYQKAKKNYWDIYLKGEKK